MRITRPKLVKKIRTNVEHFEAGNCKDQKKKKNYISSKHVTKE